MEQSAPHKAYVTYDKVHALSYAVYQQIKKDGFKPQLIITPTRGGLGPTNCLSGETMLNLRHIVSIAVESYSDDKEQGKIRLLLPFHVEDLQDYKNILVVDDLADTGKTLEFILGLLKPLTATIKTAALYCKTKKTTLIPDYYVEDTEDWIVFPQENQ